MTKKDFEGSSFEFKGYVITDKVMLNGDVYVKESVVDNKKEEVKNDELPLMYDQFNEKTFVKLQKKMSNLLSWADEPISYEKALSQNELGKLDYANVSMVVAKSNRAKIFLSHYIEREDVMQKVPELSYKANDGEETSSKYSIEYLRMIFEIFSVQEKYLVISVRNDFPLTVENDDFKIILAPRIDDEKK